jgi:hypothetical protein
MEEGTKQGMEDGMTMENAARRPRIRSKPMKSSAVRHYSLALVAGTFVGLIGTVFFFADTQYSWPVVSWRQRFERDITETGQVRLADLVSFHWEWIYLLETYEPDNPEDNALIFAKTNMLNAHSWKNNQNYWTVAYTRPGYAPLLIRMDRFKWRLRQFGYFRSADPNVKLRVVPPNSIEATWCPSRPGTCLALDDSRSENPTIPQR